MAEYLLPDWLDCQLATAVEQSWLSWAHYTMKQFEELHWFHDRSKQDYIEEKKLPQALILPTRL